MLKLNNIGSIAFIESNTTGTGEKFIQTALKNGFDVLFFTKDPAKYDFIKKLLLHPILIDTNNPEELYNYLKNITNLKSVLSTSENFIYNASIVAQKLALPCAKPDSIQKCRNKANLIEFLTKAKLPAIRTKLVNNTAQADEALKQFNFPIVVKPNYGTGSVGVKLCSTLGGANEHIKYLANNNNTDGILIQEYIYGDEFSVEIIALGNKYHLLGITKKYLGAEPYFVEISHEFPALLEPSIAKKIFTVVVKALQAVEFTFGPVHIELRIYKEKIYIIEINPRLAGGMIPILIEQAQGIKLIDKIIKLYTGQSVKFTPKTSFATKIAFILPKHEGRLNHLRGMEAIEKQTNIVGVKLYKSVGDNIEINGNFSDRLGFIIAKGQDLTECRKSILTAFDKLDIDINPDGKTDNIASCHARDRLSTPLNPKIKLILAEKSIDDLTDLQLLSSINKAHTLMLQQSNIITTSQACLIINAVKSLEDNNFANVAHYNDPSVGYYLAYEQCLINMLGIETAGNIHIGRSRNDINATIQRLKSRRIFINLFTAIWSLRSNLLQVAADSLMITMPIYSQYQPAMPATYAYYLLAIENALAVSQYSLKKTIAIINTSPLGASAGAGTMFAIEPTITAKLLGFDAVVSNALLAIASRELELTLLSCGAVLGVNLSRVAQDYQQWSTVEYNFIEFSDSLCGISSSMPQKKNPYLLEKIKGKAIAISGTLTHALAIMHKTPFANSVEVSTEALINYTNSFDELIKAIKLLELIINDAKPKQEKMKQSNRVGLTIATAVAESLTKRQQNFTYREAHKAVGQAIASAISNELDPLDAILKLDENIPTNPEQWHLLFEHGHGPGKNSTENMLVNSAYLLNEDAKFFRFEMDKWQEASDLLMQEVAKLLTT